jgi:plasmid stabilization system protein ParE
LAEVAWTEEAAAWVRDIYEHIAADNPEAAERVVQGLYLRAEQLRDHPESGYRYSGSRQDIRILVYGHYRIAYRLTEDRNVLILGVYHGALDLTRYLY